MSTYRWEAGPLPVGDVATRIGPLRMFWLTILASVVIVTVSGFYLLTWSAQYPVLDAAQGAASVFPDFVGSLLLVAAAMLALSWKLRTDLETQKMETGAKEELTEHLDALSTSMLVLALSVNVCAGLSLVLALGLSLDAMPAARSIGTALSMAIVLSFGARLPMKLERERQAVRNAKEVERLHRLLDRWRPRQARGALWSLIVIPILVLVYYVLLIVSTPTHSFELSVCIALLKKSCLPVLLLAGLGGALDLLRVGDAVAAWLLALPLLLLTGCYLMISGMAWVWTGGLFDLGVGVSYLFVGLSMLFVPARHPWSLNPRFIARRWARWLALRRLRRFASAQ